MEKIFIHLLVCPKCIVTGIKKLLGAESDLDQRQCVFACHINDPSLKFHSLKILSSECLCCYSQ